MTDAQLQSEVAPHSASVREHSRAAATWAVGHVAAGLRGLCGPRSHQAFGILMYHRITEPVPRLA